MPNTLNPRPINKCQYWLEREPTRCVFWNQENTVCTYEEELIINNTSVIVRGDLYPFCNYIGTAKFACSKYDNGTGEEFSIAPICVLPDPNRHVSISPGCSKWATPTTTSGIEGTEHLDYSRITEYNDGLCNYVEGDDTTGGTATTCAGFSPHHLGFNANPPPSKCTLSGVIVTSTDADGASLPLNYEIFNKRAELGRCYWWQQGEDYLFKLVPSSDGTSLDIEAPKFVCTNSDPYAQEYADFFEDTENFYIRPPCNGATPDCPKYTGSLASTGHLPYLSNIYCRLGDKVMAEQVLELRYNIKKDSWDTEKYDLIFGRDVSIYANSGVTPEVVITTNNTILDYSLVAIQTHIADFNCFTFERKQVLLTKGTVMDDYKTDFYALIKEIKELPLEPIIRSKFDTNDSGQNIFESVYTGTGHILLIGEYFGENSVFAINISDEEIAFPLNDLFEHGCMADYKEYLASDYETVHDQLTCYFKVLSTVMPEKIYKNEWADNNSAFAVSVETFYGLNKIVVFDVNNHNYSFTTITIRKYFCGGVIAQTGFEVATHEKEITNSVDYETTTCFPLNPHVLSYEFKPFGGSDGGGAIPYYTYLDVKLLVPPPEPGAFQERPTYILTYKMYKVQVLPMFFVSECDTTTTSSLSFIGNAGYILLYIDDQQKLHNVIRNWDTGEVDENGNPTPMKLYLAGRDSLGEDRKIELEVVEHCSQRLEINQMILKPKKMEDYTRLYGAFVIFENGLYVYERWSFDHYPASKNFEEIRDGYPEDADIVYYTCTLGGENSQGEYKLMDLPTSPLVASVMFKGLQTQRIKGQTKSDLMIWVKQPFCSDVEIMYAWSANYDSYILLPAGYCFASQIGKWFQDSGTGGSAPPCGDHSFGRISQRPSVMWYPYKACDTFANYAQNKGSGEYDMAPMEFWMDSKGRFDIDATGHGAHDLRMLGPAGSYGMTVDTHSKVWKCGCDYTHKNTQMNGKPWFSGWARVRSGVEGEAYEYLIQNGGTPPKFGNKPRGYLLSFRSVAALNYYEYPIEGGVVRKKKWLPIPEAFSDMHLNKGFEEFPWKHYFNEGDNTATYLSQIGLLAADGYVDKQYVGETLVKDFGETVLKRYRFDEIFIPHYTTTGMVYPQPRKVYYIGSDIPKPVTAWLTYKEYNEVPGKAIQWAWREKWLPLERYKIDIREYLRYSDTTACALDDLQMSYLSFLNIMYTNYTYDFMIKEYRRVPTEGDHIVFWEPSLYIPETPLPTYFLLRLDSGPVRLFSPRLELITDPEIIPEGLVFSSTTIEDIKKHINFYEACSSDSWLNGQTSSMDLEGMGAQAAAIGNIDTLAGGLLILYDSEADIVEDEDTAKTNAEEAERMVTIYDYEGKEAKFYYNRGLVVDILEDRLNYLPKISKFYTESYLVSFSVPSNDTTNFSVITVGELYPINTTFGMVYNANLGSEVTLTFHFDSKLVISRVEVLYEFGEDIESEENADLYIRTYYNIPSMSIKKSKDATNFTEIHEAPFELAKEASPLLLQTKTYTMDSADFDYMIDLYDTLSLTFGYKPSQTIFDEAKFENLASYTHLLSIKTIKFYTVEFQSQKEKIFVYERKFNISVGEYGTYPIHGYENTGSLLYPDPFETSTVYQYDNAWGMVGMPNSAGDFTSIAKTRGRLAARVREDGEVLAGTYTDFEAEQKSLYDEVAFSGSQFMTFNSLTNQLFKDTLLGTNVNVFPTWFCQLNNSVIIPLAPVKQEYSYYPEGHRWTWDVKSFKLEFGCGGGGMRSYVTTFAYGWGRVSNIFGLGYETDIFDLYSYGLSKTLTAWVNGFTPTG